MNRQRLDWRLDWQRALLVVMGGLLVSAVILLSSAGSEKARALPVERGGANSPTVGGPFLQYQARLLDPATGQPKSDGAYQMSFRLYQTEAGGAPLWTETKQVSVSNGLFSTLLGETTPLNLSIFDGRALWLGITVGADPEATPRLPVAYTAYALYALNTGALNGQPASAFAAAAHPHAGADITTGVVIEPRIDQALARDDEIMPLVLGRDGAGSTLDADLLDGQQAAAFAAASHNHSTAQITSGVLATDRFSAYEDLASEAKIGLSAGQVAQGNHAHDDRYYVKEETENRFVNAAGDGMTGVLTVPEVRYTNPRTGYYMVGSAAFVPGSNLPYQNTYGNGGAYLASGSGAMVADIHLPQGAQVTGFRAYFYDDSASDMTVYLDAEGLAGGFTTMTQVNSAGITGYGNSTNTAITLRTINNTAYSYLVYAWSTGWNSNLRIKGALITYTISEVP